MVSVETRKSKKKGACLYVSQVKIVNFRSIAQAEILLSGYTALVGLNDSGKSNLLRALNLFFNGQTDIGYRLSFLDDFSQQAKVIGGKARQIEIELEFNPPKNYADSEPVIWRKTFRADSEDPIEDRVFKKDLSEFQRNSRTEYWVRHFAFEYVPAIRGKPFFAILKRRLYTTLSETVAPRLTGASSTFLSDLRKEVKKIESESQRLLQLKTEFALPGDLGELFEALDFRSTDADSSTALQHRGDGIQGRHVPLILKFLAEQRKINSAKGKPPSETIWGFEEPENNLELAKQIEASEELREYSKSIQMLVSTHSPAFYAIAQASGAIRIAKRVSGKTVFVESVAPQEIDSHLGLMPFVAPYLKAAVAERDRFASELAALEEAALVKDRAAAYVEGSTDRRIIQAALAALQLQPNFDVMAKDGMGGGANWIVGCCVARAAMTDLKHKTLAVFDDDLAGHEGKGKLETQCLAIGRAGKVGTVVIAKDNSDDEVRRIKLSGIKVAFGIEELCGREAWEHAEANDWLEERGPLLIKDNSHLLTKDKTLSAVLDQKVDDLHVRRLIEFRVKSEKKGAFAKHVADAFAAKLPVPPSLQVLVTSIHSYFS